ncbi:MAG: hypothetical protein ACP5I3_11980 [Thermoproteus sp.]
METSVLGAAFAKFGAGVVHEGVDSVKKRLGERRLKSLEELQYGQFISSAV